MKKLTSFTVYREEEVEEKVSSTNKKGETVITVKKDKQKVPHKFFLAKPTRSLLDLAQLFNSAEVNRGRKAGLSSIYIIDKEYRDEGGVFTTKDNIEYNKLLDSLLKTTEEHEKLALVPESEHTTEQKARKEELTKEITKTRLQIQDFERIKNGLYVHTAEYRARNLLITWWVLNLAFKDEAGKESPFFGSGTYEDRLKKYDELSEMEDPFISKVLERFLFTVSFWVINAADKTEDFDELDKLIEEASPKLIEEISPKPIEEVTPAKSEEPIPAS